MSWRIVAKSCVFTSLGVITFCDMIGTVAFVDGASMQPTLNPTTSKWHDYVYLNKMAARGHKFKHGDVVALTSPRDPKENQIKRVIGLPGDKVRTLRYKLREVVVEPGHVWVEGDNKSNSIDSNFYGPVPMGLVYAKATHVILPLWRSCRLTPSFPEERVTVAQS